MKQYNKNSIEYLKSGKMYLNSSDLYVISQSNLFWGDQDKEALERLANMIDRNSTKLEGLDYVVWQRY